MNSFFSTSVVQFRKIAALLMLVLVFSFSSCDELTDCIASATPELPNKQLAAGTVGVPYTEKITAEINNDTNDNGYAYYFNVEGTPPQGITYTVHMRSITFAGTPVTAGNYNFKVVVRVDPPASYEEDGGFFSDGDRICFGDDTTEHSYTIAIQ